MTTLAPSRELTGNAQVSYGRFNDIRSQAYVSVPLSSDLAVSLAGYYRTSDVFRRDLLTGAIAYLKERGLDTIEANEDAERAWVKHTNEIAAATLLPGSTTSWYMGSNIPGKPRRVLVYMGGAPMYRAKVIEVENNGYQGFTLSASGTPTVALYRPKEGP